MATSGVPLIDYRGHTSFLQTLERHQILLKENKTTEQYINFVGVPDAEFHRISNTKSLASSFARFAFWKGSRVLTAKVVPGFDHEYTAGLFRMMIDKEIFTMGIEDDVAACSSPLTAVGRWRKEPDACWIPTGANQPTVVTEVGLSESASQLIQDARGWLETAGSSTRIAFTISVSRNSYRVTIGAWELANRASSITTRSSSMTATRISSIILSRASGSSETTITGESFDPITRLTSPAEEIKISFEKLIPRQPVGCEHDIILSKTALLKFAGRLFQAQEQQRQ